MHKVYYKKGWLELPKELINLGRHETIVIFPCGVKAIILMTMEEYDKAMETCKTLEDTKWVLRRILAYAVLIEIKKCHHRKNKIKLSEYFINFLGMEKTEDFLEGNSDEFLSAKGIKVWKP